MTQVRLDSGSIRPAGERGLLIAVADLAVALRVRSALLAEPVTDQADVVPGAASVLVRLARPGRLVEVRESLLRKMFSDSDEHTDESAEVLVPVVYDGADLVRVAELTGLSTAEVIAAHTGRQWTVGFAGFAPGFGYLVGGDPRLAVPRRSSPRTTVPTGAVGLADGFSGIYPQPSPGGWQLIGRTDLRIWDVDRDPPALLTPGVRVRFRSVGAHPSGSGDGADRPPARSTGGADSAGVGTGGAGAGSGFRVIASGPMATLQDRGRAGLAHLGVGPSGVADRGAGQLANSLVGNDPDAAMIESTLGGLRLRAVGTQLVAVTGAVVPLTVTGADGSADPIGMATAHPLPDGADLRLGNPRTGLRTYVAVAGGFAGRQVLGSRSTDLLSGIGPAPLRRGDEIGVAATGRGSSTGRRNPDAAAVPPTDDAGPVGPVAPVGSDPADSGGADVTVLPVWPGPDDSWFAPDELDALAGTVRTVSARSNRVGLRLDGPGVARARDGEFPTAGLVRGAIQVPPSGELVVFLADHPVTGGYPVVGVLTDAAIDRAAQLRPGQRVRLCWADSGRDR